MERMDVRGRISQGVSSCRLRFHFCRPAAASRTTRRQNSSHVIGYLVTVVHCTGWSQAVWLHSGCANLWNVEMAYSLHNMCMSVQRPQHRSNPAGIACQAAVPIPMSSPLFAEAGTRMQAGQRQATMSADEGWRMRCHCCPCSYPGFGPLCVRTSPENDTVGSANQQSSSYMLSSMTPAYSSQGCTEPAGHDHEQHLTGLVEGDMVSVSRANSCWLKCAYYNLGATFCCECCTHQ
jgi:hypothetical protein